MRIETAADGVEPNDIRTELRQCHAAQRRRDKGRAFNDAETRQDAWHGSDHLLLTQARDVCVVETQHFAQHFIGVLSKLRAQTPNAGGRFRELRYR